jgi:uncharacterized iron-regulated membrane protein
MFHRLRGLHRWIGVINSLFIVMIACTGFLLAIKKRAVWLQPPTNKGEQIERMSDVVSLDAVANAAFSAGLPELQTKNDIDRFELHVDKNIFKVTSKKGFREVQVEARTGRVLSTGHRNDSLTEQIHDMSFISPWLHDWVLPAVAVLLFLLGVTGIYMFFVPVFRRMAFRRKQNENHLPGI